MKWGPTAVQKAIFDILNNDATLTALIGVNKVFDFIPDEMPTPFVHLQIKPVNDRGNESYEGLSVVVGIDVWVSSPKRGDLAVQDIQKRIDELLHNQDISLEDWHPVSFRRELIDIVVWPDNVTRQGIQVFNLMMGEN